MTDPTKHHYLPVFYLKRWAIGAPDGKLVSFRKWPRGKITPLRLHPEGIGYHKSLYSLGEVEPESTQEIERLFMQPVDNDASYALCLLESNARRTDWPPRLRRAWVKFLRSLSMRMPPDIIALKTSYLEGWGEVSIDHEQEYQRLRQPSDPPTAAEFFKQMPLTELQNHALKLIPWLADNEEIGELLMNLHWFVVDADPDGLELLTSDRPLTMAPFELDDAYLTLPIGPTKIFWAVKHPKWEVIVRSQQPKDWVRRQNERILRQASFLAISRTDDCQRFVQKHLGATPEVSVFERMRRRAREQA